jgi:hypothetical protein
MRVKSVREHNNSYGVAQGGPVRKAVGHEYDLADAVAETLIAAGLVEEVKAEAKAAKASKPAD